MRVGVADETSLALEFAAHEGGEDLSGRFRVAEHGADFAEDGGVDAAGGAEFVEGLGGLVSFDHGFAAGHEFVDRSAFAEACSGKDDRPSDAVTRTRNPSRARKMWFSTERRIRSATFSPIPESMPSRSATYSSPP